MGRRLQVQSVGCRIENAELKIENAGRQGRRLPVAIVLQFDRVGRREPPPTGLVTYIAFGCRVRRPRRTVNTNKLHKSRETTESANQNNFNEFIARCLVNARFVCSNFIAIKFIAYGAAFPLPKKFGYNPRFSGTLCRSACLRCRCGRR